MANTVQTQTAKTILSTDLSAVTADRLIELCILYRSVPDADTTYPERLKTELERRYDASAINSDETTYAVLQHLSNQIDPWQLQNMQQKMQEMYSSSDREAWFAADTLFSSALRQINFVSWIADNYLVMTAIASSSTAMSAILASSTAMSAIAASSTAMSAIAASSTAMSAIAASSTARNALIAHNGVLQSVRQVLYEMVKAHWKKTRSVSNDNASRTNSVVANPAGLVFACLGYYNSSTATTTMLHENGSEAATAGSTSQPKSMQSLDGVSFNGATFTESGDGHVYVELWTPKGE